MGLKFYVLVTTENAAQYGAHGVVVAGGVNYYLDSNLTQGISVRPANPTRSPCA